MDGKVSNYYKNNFLYSGHRMILPVSGEKFRSSCIQCKYFVDVVGQQETRKICLNGVKTYRSGNKKVPENIEIIDLIFLLGKEALQSLLKEGGQYQAACGSFEQRF